MTTWHQKGYEDCKAGRSKKVFPVEANDGAYRARNAYNAGWHKAEAETSMDDVDWEAVINEAPAHLRDKLRVSLLGA